MKYAERQKQWVAEHGVEIGSVVKVVRRATSYQEEWGTTWEPQMDETLGEIGEVETIDDSLGLAVRFANRAAWYLPFFVLEPTEWSVLECFAKVADIFRKGGTVQTSVGELGMDEDGTVYAVMKGSDGEDVRLVVPCDVKNLADLALEVGPKKLWLRACELGLRERRGNRG